MSSFYGGKQGRTYHIVARYDCINLENYINEYGDDFTAFSAGTTYKKGNKVKEDREYYFILAEGTFSSVDDLKDEEKAYHIRGMVQLFAKGGAYTEANYGEYVLIDTIFNLNHKSDLLNGLLYRRGFDYNLSFNDNQKPDINDPFFYDENNNFNKDLWQATWDAWIQKPGAGAIYVGQIVGPQGDSPEIIPIKWEDLNARSSKNIIIPSSTTRGNNKSQVIDNEGNIIYNDKGDPIWAGDAIKVGSYTTRDSDNNITGAEIAFDIPIPIFDPPNVNINEVTYKGSSKLNLESKDHPFYYVWDFNIPQVTDLTKEKGSLFISKYETDGLGNYVDERYLYITYKVHNANAAGVVLEHLGRWPYRVIDNIEFSKDDPRPFIFFDSGTAAEIGDLYDLNITSFNGNAVCAVCIERGLVDSNFLPAAAPDGDSEPYVLGYESRSGESLWRVIEIPKATPAHSLTVNYKAGEPTLFTNLLQNIDYLTVDSKGKLYVKYSNSNLQYYLTTINGIKLVYLSDDGLYITYIDDREPSFFSVKQIDSIELLNQDNIELSQKFIVNYKDGSILDVSDNLNTILTIEMQGDNIVALYSDPDYRNNFKENNEENKDWFLRPWTDPNNSKIVYDLEEDEESYIDLNNVTHYHKLVWVNLTSRKGTYHVQGEYTYNDLETILIKGFGDVPDLQDRIGWLVTVQDGSIKRIYAYDYNDISDDPSYLGKYTFPDGVATHWYEIFSLAASSIEPELSVYVDSRNNEQIARTKLNKNGLWFVTYSGHDGNTTETAVVGTAIVGQSIVG